MMMRLGCFLLLLLCSGADALSSFQPKARARPGANENDDATTVTDRRSWLEHYVSAVSASTTLLFLPTFSSTAHAEDTSIYSPKFVQSYEDFVQTPEGWSYRDVKTGSAGASSYQAQRGDRVVFDWSGYTIGYFGRPFQAKGGPQGGAFDKDLDYMRTVLGSGKMITGLEKAFLGMSAGGVRQVIIPYGDLSYPPSDPDHDMVGPKPSTFSGMRALNFVLENPRVDRTLLFNVKVVRIDQPDGKGGFKRG